MILITWNVQWSCGLDGRVDVERIVRGARELGDFDVLCLQEVASNYPRLAGDAGDDQPARLAALLPGWEIAFGAAVDERGPDGRRQRFGNLVATRLPLLQVQHQALPWPADAGVRCMPRMCTTATVQAAWGPLRVSTTHLEFYSPRQRLAQARALRALHAQAAALAAAPPSPDDDGSPFQAKPHTPDALLTGDFNFETTAEEYALLTAPGDDGGQLHDGWRRVHGERPHDPTFRVFDRTYGPVPLACDFVFASASVAPRLRRMQVDGTTQASDHQPVLVELSDG